MQHRISFDDTGFLYPGFATERDFCSVPFWSPKTIQDNEHSCSVPFYSKRNGKYIVIPRWTNITPFILLKQDIPFLNYVYSQLNALFSKFGLKHNFLPKGPTLFETTFFSWKLQEFFRFCFFAQLHKITLGSLNIIQNAWQN